MTWTASEILAMLRRAKQVGVLSPDPHADSPLGEMPQPEPDAGTDRSDVPPWEPDTDPGPEA